MNDVNQLSGWYASCHLSLTDAKVQECFRRKKDFQDNILAKNNILIYQIFQQVFFLFWKSFYRMTLCCFPFWKTIFAPLGYHWEPNERIITPKKSHSEWHPITSSLKPSNLIKIISYIVAPIIILVTTMILIVLPPTRSIILKAKGHSYPA